MSPADQHPAIGQRSTDPPTLWLSLALGSVLLHLVAFILISVVFTRTAKVQLDAEPITVEFVDPDANPVQAQAAAPTRAIAARPGAPSVSAPQTTPIPPPAIEPKRSVESSIIPLPPVRRRPLPLRTQQPVPLRPPFSPQPSPTISQTQPQPSPTISQTQPQPQPNPTRTPFPQQPNAPESGQTQPTPAPNLARTGSPGSALNPFSSPDPQPSGTQKPAQGSKIAQLPQGDNVAVTVSNPRQTTDFQKQPARPIELQKTVSIRYSSALANQTIHLQASLFIDQKGAMLQVLETRLISSSSEGAIDADTLKDLANQIFSQWRFEPAQDAPLGKPLTPSSSNLIIDAQVQLP